MRPRLLDLFCGAGGCSVGYHRAGFDVVGVDLEGQPRYPFDFIKGDALKIPLGDFQAIHASPPCQAYSSVTPKSCRANHQDLIGAVRERLLTSGLPFIIENVVGARKKLRNPILLCGSMFGLRSQRHRLFECHPELAAPIQPCDHSLRPLLVTTAGANSRAIREPGQYKSVRNAPAAYGIDWMTADGLKESVPPAYTGFLGHQLMRVVNGNAVLERL